MYLIEGINIMKKTLKIGSFMVCLFTLLACSGKETTNNEKKPEENQPSETNNDSGKTDNNNGDNNNEENNPNEGENQETFVDMELSNKNGLVVKFANKGAKIDSVKLNNVKIAENGFVAGRVANRIANAKFDLDGVTYNIDKNQWEKHCLHGGRKGFGEIDWTKSYQNASKIVFSLDSADGDQGFPGKMHVTTTYTLNDDGTLDIEYSAKCDKKTLFNPTNHLYMNMNGIDTGTWNNHTLWTIASEYTKADNDLIPTGEFASVTGTTLDYTTKADYKGNNDSNLVLSKVKETEYKKVAELTGKTTGITCEVSTDRVGLQLYNDNGHICLEAQDFPDAIHHSNFPSIVLEANEEYYSKTTYKFIKA